MDPVDVAGQGTFSQEDFRWRGFWIKLNDKYITQLVEALNLDSNKGKAVPTTSNFQERLGI